MKQDDYHGELEIKEEYVIKVYVKIRHRNFLARTAHKHDKPHLKLSIPCMYYYNNMYFLVKFSIHFILILCTSW
jgi:hypothetical protein